MAPRRVVIAGLALCIAGTFAAARARAIDAPAVDVIRDAEGEVVFLEDANGNSVTFIEDANSGIVYVVDQNGVTTVMDDGGIED